MIGVFLQRTSYAQLIDQDEIDLMIYTSTVDPLLGPPQTEAGVNRIFSLTSSSRKRNTSRTLWMPGKDESVSGYSECTDSESGNTRFCYVVVRNAGHMTPAFKPRESLDMFNRFISGHSFEGYDNEELERILPTCLPWWCWSVWWFRVMSDFVIKAIYGRCNGYALVRVCFVYNLTYCFLNNVYKNLYLAYSQPHTRSAQAFSLATASRAAFPRSNFSQNFSEKRAIINLHRSKDLIHFTNKSITFFSICDNMHFIISILLILFVSTNARITPLDTFDSSDAIARLSSESSRYATTDDGYILNLWRVPNPGKP